MSEISGQEGDLTMMGTQVSTQVHRWWVDRYTGCHIGERCLEVAFISGSPTKWVTWALSQCPWGLKISVMNVNVNSLQWILAHTKMGRFEPTQILFRESYLWLPNAIVSHLLPCLVIILYLDCFCILCLRNDLWKSCVLCSVHLLVLINPRPTRNLQTTSCWYANLS